MSELKTVIEKHFPGIEFTYLNDMYEGCNKMKMTIRTFKAKMFALLLLGESKIFTSKAAPDQEVSAEAGDLGVIVRKDRDTAVVRYKNYIFTLSKDYIFDSHRKITELQRQANENRWMEMDAEIKRLASDGNYYKNEKAIEALEAAKMRID